jgi:hypothetical protein
MLFKFGKFWKSLSFVVGTWILYGAMGFEFATITLLALIFASNFNENTKFI